MKINKPLNLIVGKPYNVYYNDRWDDGFYLGEKTIFTDNRTQYAFRRLYGVAYIPKNEALQRIKK